MINISNISNLLSLNNFFTLSFFNIKYAIEINTNICIILNGKIGGLYKYKNKITIKNIFLSYKYVNKQYTR